MTTRLKEELKKIGGYRLSIRMRSILRENKTLAVDFDDAARVAALLDKYKLDFNIDHDCNFNISGCRGIPYFFENY